VIVAPDVTTWYGRRDQAILVLTLQTGLRVTELITLSCSDIALGAGAHGRCMGKGRKERATPDMQMKEKAMARTRPVDAKPGRYRPGDKLLAFLEAL